MLCYVMLCYFKLTGGWKKSRISGRDVIEVKFQHFSGGTQENSRMLSVFVMAPLKLERDTS